MRYHETVFLLNALEENPFPASCLVSSETWSSKLMSRGPSKFPPRLFPLGFRVESYALFPNPKR